MKIYTIVKKNTYHDSMKMMQFQAVLNKIPGITGSGVAMATPANKSQFRKAELLTEQVQEAGPNDLCIIVKAESDNAISLAILEIDKYFKPKKPAEQYLGKTDILPKSIASALKRLPTANLAFISVPGEYAALEATKALNNGLHVFLFSDNVPLKDEIELKALAEQKRLLVMGPDCGTAIISGIGLGFSNAVRQGRIGIVGASGSGMQEICCLIHRMGEGISQAIGTGGRDLSTRVGGKTFIRALDALLKNEGTDVIILMSKHCDEKVAKRMVERASEGKKPLVVYFPGSDYLINGNTRYIYRVENLEHVATSSVAILRGNAPPKPVTREAISREMSEVIRSESSKFPPKQKYVRALFTGGSFADQATMTLPTFFKRVYAYPSGGKTLGLDNPEESRENSIVDLGDDFFTLGRVHPMIDPRPRNERLIKEVKDKEVKVILLDVVLGFGAHIDPVDELSKIISDAKEKFEKDDSYLSFVVSLCGTGEDPQNFEKVKKKLQKSGAVVTESSTRAVLLAALIGCN